MSCAFVKRIATLFAASLLGITLTTHAQPVQVNAEGVGQVLIYPYYTTRNGWSTLLSIVNNDSANGKAIKLRFLEGKNGALVASLNVFLGVDDIWTAAVVAGAEANDPPRLVSNDTSCTWPSLRKQGTITETGSIVTTPVIAFSNRAYIADGDADALQTMDRTREGYVEVIEMASIPYNRVPQSPLVLQISNASYVQPQPPCTAVSDADLFRYAGQIAPATGGLSGAATLINVLGGVSTEYTPVALGGFWAIGSNQPQLTPSASALPDLSSGGNLTSQVSYEGKTYFSKFNRSIDAVSAVLMSEQLLGEHAYTSDGVISTTWLVASPTKRFYTQGNATAPYSRRWDGASGNACEDIQLASYDRNSTPYDDSCPNLCPPRPVPQGLCYAASALGFGSVTPQREEQLFRSPNIVNYGYFSYGYSANQSGAGKTRLGLAASSAFIASASGSLTQVDPGTGVVSTSSGPHTFYGLPMIGIAFTQSSFKLGNPQQNFGGGYRLQSTRRIVAQ